MITEKTSHNFKPISWHVQCSHIVHVSVSCSLHVNKKNENETNYFKREISVNRCQFWSLASKMFFTPPKILSDCQFGEILIIVSIKVKSESPSDCSQLFYCLLCCTMVKRRCVSSPIAMMKMQNLNFQWQV